MGAKTHVAESATAAPAEALAPLVRRYIGYRYEGFSPGTHLGLPSRHLTIVITLGAPLRLAAPGLHRHAAADFSTLVGGLHTRPAIIMHDGNQYGVQLELTPAGARSLFGTPAGELAAAVVGLDDLLGPKAYELAERMASAPTWPLRFAVLNEVLAGRTDRLGAYDRTLAHAWDRVVASGGAARVADVAAEVGWSRRHLSERFAREYGLTVKEAARVVRFERSKRLLQCGGRPTLADVAVACGYYDQAHLAREWNDLAGCPPSAWLAAEELPFVQGAATGQGAR
ncbi:MAG: helix-turn-helix domain-containing protein [Streptosporangiaceae bacterium]